MRRQDAIRRPMRTRLVFSSALIASLLPFQGALANQVDTMPERGLALVGGTIYVSPTEDPIRDGVVLTQGGKIAAVGPRALVRIPKGTEILDCSGLTVVAGLWNSHVHFIERKWADASEIPAPELREQLQAMLVRYGFTSVFDTGSMWANTRRLRDRIESGDIPGPRIRSTGEILFPKGGAPPELILDVSGSMRVTMPEVADAAEALAAARKHLDAGTDGIKLYAATWAPPIVSLPESAIRAAADEAHRRKKPVFAHPSNREGLLAAVRGGADILVHTAPQSGPWDEATLAAMKKAGVAVIPTLKLWRYELRHDRISDLERFAGMGVDQLRAWLGTGGEVLFGTDVGYMDDYDPSDEYALMAEAGMSASQILSSLTVVPAKRFGDSARLGRIATGLAADLAVLSEDPSKNVRAFAAVRYTIRNGTVIYQASQ
ncbi:MAG: amidohydrolase family protein [Luteitalea sp.]|nr:amidohydrolase family protein [Luteitalea sp.]